MSKVVEKVLLDQIETYIFKQKNILHCQYGFRPKRSTVILLNKLNKKIRMNLSNGNLTVLLLLDYPKAFDTIAHDILIFKLHKIGFNTSALRLILSYLRERQVQTFANEELSTSCHCLSGVPQGSILGPMLFNLYVNDISNCLPHDAQVFQYADDCQIVLTFEKRSQRSLIDSKISQTLKNLREWSSKNNLCLNTSKTQILPIFQKNSCFERMKFFDQDNFSEITFIKEAKNLGIIYNNRLSWTNHFDHLTKTMRGYIYIVRTFFKRYTTWKNSKLRLKISMSLLFAKMKYGVELFFDCNEACTHKWNIISKRIASIVLNKYCSKDDVF